MDHVANPFLHTYHPDHDNLNADFDATSPVWSLRDRALDVFCAEPFWEWVQWIVSMGTPFLGITGNHDQRSGH